MEVTAPIEQFRPLIDALPCGAANARMCDPDVVQGFESLYQRKTFPPP